MFTRVSLSALMLSAALAGCGGGNKLPPDQQALIDVKLFIQKNLDDLATATVALRDAAPAPDADGWNAAADPDAVKAMKTHWKEARLAYEHVEGAIAVLFSDLDVSTDERYDGFIQNGHGDDNLFDDQGVTGIHAIERILWSDSIPQRVIDFEDKLTGYVPAAFPATQQQASDFKDKLCKRLIDDVQSMRSQLAPRALDTQTAYRGIIGSMNEQIEKAEKAAGGEEESRYAQYTLADMRANVAAGVTTFDAFEPWLLTTSDGGNLAGQIRAGFKAIQDEYDSIPGDALPPVPPTWSSMPSKEDQETPFGQLYELLKEQSDPAKSDSLLSAMNRSADALKIPRLAQ